MARVCSALSENVINAKRCDVDEFFQENFSYQHCFSHSSGAFWWHWNLYAFDTSRFSTNGSNGMTFANVQYFMKINLPFVLVQSNLVFISICHVKTVPSTRFIQTVTKREYKRNTCLGEYRFLHINKFLVASLNVCPLLTFQFGVFILFSLKEKKTFPVQILSNVIKRLYVDSFDSRCGPHGGINTIEDKKNIRGK